MIAMRLRNCDTRSDRVQSARRGRVCTSLSSAALSSGHRCGRAQPDKKGHGRFGISAGLSSLRFVRNLCPPPAASGLASPVPVGRPPGPRSFRGRACNPQVAMGRGVYPFCPPGWMAEPPRVAAGRRPGLLGQLSIRTATPRATGARYPGCSSGE